MIIVIMELGKTHAQSFSGQIDWHPATIFYVSRICFSKNERGAKCGTHARVVGSRPQRQVHLQICCWVCAETLARQNRSRWLVVRLKLFTHRTKTNGTPSWLRQDKKLERRWFNRRQQWAQSDCWSLLALANLKQRALWVVKTKQGSQGIS